MVIINAGDYDALSRMVATVLYAQLLTKPGAVLGLATGGTPLGAYRYLAEWVERDGFDCSGATTFNLDEYCGLASEHPQSYAAYMEENLFRRLRVGASFLPDGTARDPEAECRRYDELIRGCGGIDLQLLGLGHNGHIGFNEPGASFAGETHRVELSQRTIEANARFYGSPGEVPRTALTMGVGTIMRSRAILLAVCGEDKAEILGRAVNGPVTPEVPASVLQLHPAVTVIHCVGTEIPAGKVIPCTT